jgi:hypothetical protein
MSTIGTNKVPKGTGADITGLNEGIIYDDGSKIGIGTTSPGTKLDVVDTNAAGAVVQQVTNTGYSNLGLYVYGNNTGDSWLNKTAMIYSGSSSEKLLIAAPNATEPIVFAAGGYGSSNERMRISAGGNVGVGVTSPGAKMEIKGAAGDTGLNVVDSDSVEMLKVIDHSAANQNATDIRSSYHATNAGGSIAILPKTRDATGINEAIAYANSLSPKPVVFLPAGVYDINAQIVIHAQMTLMGAGAEATILEVNASLDADALVTDDATYGSGGWTPVPTCVVLKGFTIRPSTANTNAAHHTAIYIKGGVYPYLENIEVLGNLDGTNHINRHFKIGIHIKAWEGLLTRCIVKDAYTGFDLSWDSDLWDSTNSTDRKADYTNAVALVGCCNDVFPADPSDSTTMTSPPVSTISTASYFNSTGTITNISAAYPTVVTDNAHGLSTGDKITIVGSDSKPSIDGTWRVTVINANTFSVPVNVTTAGTTGTWKQEYIRFTTSAAHCLQHGADVSVAGCQNSNYDDDYDNVYVVDDTHFDVDDSTNPGAWQAGGNPQATGVLIGCYINGHNNSLSGCTIERHLEQTPTPKRSIGVYVKGWANTLISCYFENLRTTFKAVNANYLHILNAFRTYYMGFDSDDFVNSGSTGVSIHNGIVGKINWDSTANQWSGGYDSARSGRMGFGTVSPVADLDVNGGSYKTGSRNLSTSGSNTTVTTTNDAFDDVDVGSTIIANSEIRYVVAKTSNTQVTVDTAVNWGAGYSFTYQNPIFGLSSNGTRRLLVRADETILLPGHIYMAPYGGGDICYLQARRMDSSDTAELQIRTWNSGSCTEAIRIKGTGSVGIGTTSPGEKLEVNGDIKFGSEGVKISSGTSLPNNVVAGNPGDLYVYKNGGSSWLYINTSTGSPWKTWTAL